MKPQIITLVSFFLLFSYYAKSNNRIYVSDDIELIKLSEKAYVHVSVTQIDGFGKVSSNGLLLIDNGKAFLFDTPVTNDQTEKLIKWISKTLKAKVTAFVPNHWHEDCMGGLNYIKKQHIKSYANEKTIAIAKKQNLPLPENSFKDSLILHLNKLDVLCYYVGAAHSTDNIVAWFPSEKILFAGCMIKDIYSTGMGSTAAADMKAWPETIQKLQTKFYDAQIIIPGHGQIGGLELITHTLQLLNQFEK